MPIRYTLHKLDKSPEVSLLVKDALNDMAIEGARVAGLAAPKGTGNLARNIQPTNARQIGDVWFASIGVGVAAPYGRFVEGGTGVFRLESPGRIMPKFGKAMKFSADAGLWQKKISRRPKWQEITVKSTKGQPGRHFMWAAETHLRTQYVPLRMTILKRQIKALYKSGPGDTGGVG